MERWEASFKAAGASSEVESSGTGSSALMMWRANKTGSTLVGVPQSQVIPPKDTTQRYSAKIINPECRGGHIIEEFTTEKFHSVSSLRSKVSELFEKYINDSEFKVGYLCPGHGFKRKQLPLDTDDDLEKMFCDHGDRKSINLWIKVEKREREKRLRDADTGSSRDIQTKQMKTCESKLAKMDELQKIVDQLMEKHKQGKYTHFSSAQFHCWGSTIQLGHHDSYENPPNKPFFGLTKGSSVGSSASPGKRIHLRSECIDQLTKWHKLMSDGVITRDEYEDMHKTILGDIKKF